MPDELHIRAELPEEELLIRADLDVAFKESTDLRHEIENPTVSRLFADQVKLVEAAEAASAKCGDILNELRGCRKRNMR